MSLRIRSSINGPQPVSEEEWNSFVAAQGGHILQSWAWGQLKASFGWQAVRVVLEREGRPVAGAQVLFRPFLGASIAYVPKGPIVDLADEASRSALFAAIHRVACSQRAIFLKIEPNELNNEQTRTLLEQCGFKPTIHTNQPRSTIVIDLSKGEKSLWVDMHKKTRKLIRRAAREGVEVVEGERSDLDAFYRIIAATAEIKGIPVHGKVFYQQAWRAFCPTDSVKLMLAKHRGQVVAAKMILVFGGKSMHLWGGTSLKGREVYASYLLQWESIKWAIARGCRYCDLWGIPDEIANIEPGDEAPRHRTDGLWGVYTFKRGFGGRIESYVGAYDYVYRSLIYKLATGIVRNRELVDIVSIWLERTSDSLG